MAHLDSSHDIQGLGKKLTNEELLRGIRLMIADEYEAIQLYSQIADATNDQRAKEVIEDIIEEERKHAGQFLRLLVVLDPHEGDKYREGYDEVDQMIGTGDSHEI